MNGNDNDLLKEISRIINNSRRSYVSLESFWFKKINVFKKNIFVLLGEKFKNVQFLCV